MRSVREVKYKMNMYKRGMYKMKMYKRGNV